MAGKGLLIEIVLTLLLSMMTAGAWGADEQTPVVVLVSGEEQAYIEPIETFRSAIDRPVKVYNLQTDIEKAPRLIDEILSSQPPLIFALGAKAAFVCKIWTKESRSPPVIFAMVLNWQKYSFDSQSNMAGVAYHVLPGTQFIGLTLYAPQCKKIGVIFNRNSSAQMVAKGRKAAALLGLELVEETIDKPEGFQRAYKKIVSSIDALWLVPDPVAYTLENVAWLEERFVRDRLICLGYSRNIATEGAMIAVDPDPGNIGIQAADLAHEILAGKKSPQQVGVVEPLGTRLIVNLKIARRMGVAIRPEALDLATEVIQ